MPIRLIKVVKCFKSIEEGPPLPCKLSSYFNPQMLNAGVMSRAYFKKLKFNVNVESITYDPQMNEPQLSPQHNIIYREIALFSCP